MSWQKPALHLHLLSSHLLKIISRIEAILKSLLQDPLWSPGSMLINRALHPNSQPDL